MTFPVLIYNYEVSIKPIDFIITYLLLLFWCEYLTFITIAVTNYMQLFFLVVIANSIQEGLANHCVFSHLIFFFIVRSATKYIIYLVLLLNFGDCSFSFDIILSHYYNIFMWLKAHLQSNYIQSVSSIIGSSTMFLSPSQIK